MSRADTHVTQAREVVAFLDSIGEPKRANDVRFVLRSLATARATMGVLHRDNMELRNGHVAPAEMFIARGAPSEEALHISFDLELAGPYMDRLERECRERKCEPAALMANLIETVIKDDLFEAVIGE